MSSTSSWRFTSRCTHMTVLGWTREKCRTSLFVALSTTTPRAFSFHSLAASANASALRTTCTVTGSVLSCRFFCPNILPLLSLVTLGLSRYWPGATFRRQQLHLQQCLCRLSSFYHHQPGRLRPAFRPWRLRTS